MTNTRNRFGRLSVVLFGCLAPVLVVGGCSGDLPTAEDKQLPLASVAGEIALCHRTGERGSIMEVRSPAVSAHLRHGDYFTALRVSQGGGTDDVTRFRHIGDALASVRAGRLARGELRSAACRITITVAAGVFRGTNDIANTDRSLEHFPFEVNVPDITLRGALEMRLDASGRATGTSVTHQVTTLASIEPLSDLVGFPALIAAYGDGNGLTVEGFAFQSGGRTPESPEAAGFGVFSFQVRDLTVRGNRLEGFFETIDLEGTSAVVEANHLSAGGQCDICAAGPGVYRIVGNRILAGGTHGIFTSPAINTEPLGPGASEVFVDIINNEVRDHRQQPISAGIRVGAVGLGAPNVPGSSHILVRDNLLVNNNFGVMVDALFPQPGTELKGDIDLTASGNVVERSCQANLLVAFTRHLTALGAGGDPYLLNSTYRLTLDGGLQFGNAWFSNPPGFGNTLLVNGHEVGHRTRQFFDENSCPGSGGAI